MFCNTIRRDNGCGKTFTVAMLRSFYWKRQNWRRNAFLYPTENHHHSCRYYDELLKFFRDNDMDWDKLVGVCTYGAPAMLGCRSGLVTRLQETAKNFISTHCVIHRAALASKIISVEFKETLSVTKKIVKFIKGNDCNTRLFGQMYKDLESQHRYSLAFKR